ncbi:MAG: isocitrate/isopropylmalate family dehydrogenase, partial [Fibrobacterota bacterium]
ILSVALLLRYGLKADAAAAAIEAAVARVLDKGIFTADIARDKTRGVGTRAMGDAVVREL